MEENGMEQNVVEQNATEQKDSKALEICSLVFGILSLCGCCWGIFGIVGLVLSIIAFSKGKKSGLSIAGMVCSIIGIIVAIASIIFTRTPAYQEMMQNYLQMLQ